MTALCSRCGHYIFALWFLLLSFYLFPRLISAIADWMPTILPHLVWPLRCRSETARCNYRGQKVFKKSLYGHHRTTLSGYILATKARIDNRKKIATCFHNMVKFGPLAAEIGLVVWGTLQISMGFASWQPYCTEL